MARRKQPEDTAVEFFQTAPLDAAAAILSVCSGIVKRRQAAGAGAVQRGKPTRQPRPVDGLTPAQNAGFDRTASGS